MAVGTLRRLTLPYGTGSAFGYHFALRSLPLTVADAVRLINSGDTDLSARPDPEDTEALLLDSGSLGLEATRQQLKHCLANVRWRNSVQLRIDRRPYGPDLATGVTLWREDDGSYGYSDRRGIEAARKTFNALSDDGLSKFWGASHEIICVLDDRTPDELAEQVRLAAETWQGVAMPVTVPVTSREYGVWRLDVSQAGVPALKVAMGFATGSYCDLAHWHYSDADRFVDVRVTGGYGPDEVCGMLAEALTDMLKRPVDVPVPQSESDVQSGPEQAACDELAEALERLIKPMLDGEEVVISISVKK